MGKSFMISSNFCVPQVRGWHSKGVIIPLDSMFSRVQCWEGLPQESPFHIARCQIWLQPGLPCPTSNPTISAPACSPTHLPYPCKTLATNDRRRLLLDITGRMSRMNGGAAVLTLPMSACADWRGQTCCQTQRQQVHCHIGIFESTLMHH